MQCDVIKYLLSAAQVTSALNRRQSLDQRAGKSEGVSLTVWVRGLVIPGAGTVEDSSKPVGNIGKASGFNRSIAHARDNHKTARGRTQKGRCRHRIAQSAERSQVDWSRPNQTVVHQVKSFELNTLLNESQA